MLFIVSTPIGNLSDVTLRAIEVLRQSELVLAEDTRTALKLFSRHSIRAPLMSYNEHNEQMRISQALPMLREGKNVSLISESGTPLISDPGYRLVRECAQNQIQIVPVPGPSAILAALVVSGMPTDSFIFQGFLPKGEGKRKTLLKNLAECKKTLVLYESPHRIHKTIKAIAELLPAWGIAVCRELTKKYEEVIRGTVDDVAKRILSSEPRGEYVLVLSPKGP